MKKYIILSLFILILPVSATTQHVTNVDATGYNDRITITFDGVMGAVAYRLYVSETEIGGYSYEGQFGGCTINWYDAPYQKGYVLMNDPSDDEKGQITIQYTPHKGDSGGAYKRWFRIAWINLLGQESDFNESATDFATRYAPSKNNTAKIYKGAFSGGPWILASSGEPSVNEQVNNYSLTNLSDGERWYFKVEVQLDDGVGEWIESDQILCGWSRGPTVYISGDYELDDGERGYWTAHPDRGTTPYSYQWYNRFGSGSWNTGGTSSTYNEELYGEGYHEIKVVVTDANNDTNEDYFDVHVGSGDDKKVVIAAENKNIALLDAVNLPESYRLHQNFPNPFNPETTINFEIPIAAHVTLEVYDITGQLIEILLNNQMSPGYHSVNWIAGDYASGVYLCRLTAGNYIFTKKMLLVK